MSRSVLRSTLVISALLVSACSSTGGGLADSRAACITVASLLGGGGGSVLANQRDPRETDERMVQGGGGALAGAVVGYLVCGEGGAVALPTAAIRATPATGEAPLRVTLSADVPPGVEIESYEWDLGDGSTASGPSIAHVYRAADQFEARLTVTDRRGRTAVATARISALQPAPEPVAAAPVPDTPEVVERIVLSGVNFDFDSASISAVDRETLDGVARKLRENTQYSVRVVGHTDSLGSEPYNLGLSRRRAESVVEYLTVDHGLAEQRFELHGMGESSPVASNATEAGRAENRRVELDILE